MATLRRQQTEALDGLPQRWPSSFRGSARKPPATFGKEITARMQLLGMTGGRFQVEVSPLESTEPQPYGLDQIEFRVTANPGQPLRALAKVASGGELARLSLAVQVACMADGRHCMVFDEVDAGIGGAIAEIVGKQLRELGTRSQVLCVTHLPQVAAQGHHHLRVLKLTDGRSTRTTLAELAGQERVQEVARMLGGAQVTDKALAHAREMLAAAGVARGDTARMRRVSDRSAVPVRPQELACRGCRAKGNRLAAAAVEDHRVVMDLEAQLLGDGLLPLLDARIHELLHLAAVDAHDVVVVVATVQLEHRHAVLEMVARDQARRLELGQHPVHGGEADVLVRASAGPCRCPRPTCGGQRRLRGSPGSSAGAE